MFQELLARLQEDISTIRSIIQTNEKLRIFLSDEENQNLKEIKEIKSLTPRTSNWRIYDHCAVITRLYALYESFVRDLIKDWILYLPKIFSNYSDLSKNIRDTHQRGITTLMQELGNKKSRFENLLEDLSVEDVVKYLHDCLNSTGISYKLLPQAFILHDQNLRKEALMQLLANAGISNDWNWIEKHREIKEVLREENTAEYV